MATPGPTEQELINTVGIKGRQNEPRQTFLRRLTKMAASTELPDDKYQQLSMEAFTWHDQAVTHLNNNKKIPEIIENNSSSEGVEIQLSQAKPGMILDIVDMRSMVFSGIAEIADRQHIVLLINGEPVNFTHQNMKRIIYKGPSVSGTEQTVPATIRNKSRLSTGKPRVHSKKAAVIIRRTICENLDKDRSEILSILSDNEVYFSRRTFNSVYMDANLAIRALHAAGMMKDGINVQCIEKVVTKK